MSLLNPPKIQAETEGFFTYGLDGLGQKAWFELGGEVEAEITAGEKDSKNSFTSATGGFFHREEGYVDLHFDKVMLRPRFYYPDKKDAKFFAQGDIELLDAAFIKEMFLQFNVGKGYLKLGLDDRFFAPGDPDTRITESYPINGTSWWRDEDMQAQLGFDFKRVYLRFAVSNGLTLGGLPIGKKETYHILHDDRNTADSNTWKEGALGLGFKWGERALWDLLLFGTYTQLSDSEPNDEVALLKQVFRGYTSNEKHKAIAGVNFVVAGKENWRLVSQAIASLDGKVQRLGAYIEPSYTKNAIHNKWFSGYTLLLRYNFLYVDPQGGASEDIFDRPLSWERHTGTLAANFCILKGITFKNEFLLNFEEGGGTVDNHEFITQLEWKF